MDMQNIEKLTSDLLELFVKLEKAKTIANDIINDFFELPVETENNKNFIIYKMPHYRILCDIVEDYIISSKELTNSIFKNIENYKTDKVPNDCENI